DVAARLREAGDETAANRIRYRHKDDRYGRGRLFGRDDDRGSRCDDDIDLEPDELGRDLSETLGASLRPAILDRNGPILDPAEFAQPLHKCGDPRALRRRRGRAQEPNGRQLSRLLRGRRERPRSCRTAQQGDELAAFHLHSITSSAVCRNGSGMVRPSVFAVLRLMTSSYLVGCWTGRSLAFAPLRIRSTYPAACRNMSASSGPYEINPPSPAKNGK